MTARSRTALACLIAVLLATAFAETASAQSAFFTFRMCNRSGVTAAAVTAVRFDPGRPDIWRLQGWGILAPGECKNLVSGLRGWVYYYAEEAYRGGRGYTWAGDETQMCVDYPGPFDRLMPPGVTCDASELKGFSRSFVDGNTGLFTLNLN